MLRGGAAATYQLTLPSLASRILLLQYVSPFDHELLWEGHSTLIDELASANCKPDAIVLSVGGGGLLCGVYQGLKRHDWSEVRLCKELSAIPSFTSR